MLKDIQTDLEGEIHLKILVVGEPGVGKTSLIQSYCYGQFSTQYKATIGVDFAAKVVRINDKLTIHLQFWDLAGQDRLTQQLTVYYRGAAGAICVSDVTREETKKRAFEWRDVVAYHAQNSRQEITNVPCLLIVNKIDLLPKITIHGQTPESESPRFVIDLSDDHKKVTLTGDDLTTQDVRAALEIDYDNLARQAGFDGGIAASAKDGVGIQDAVETLLRLILENYQVPADTTVIKLNDPPPRQQSSLTSRCGSC